MRSSQRLGWCASIRKGHQLEPLTIGSLHCSSGDNIERKNDGEDIYDTAGAMALAAAQMFLEPACRSLCRQR